MTSSRWNEGEQAAKAGRRRSGVRAGRAERLPRGLRPLVANDRLGVARAERARAVVELEESVRLARVRFVGGLADYFEVLEAQQELFPAENDLARVERDRLVAVVQLYRALGGGWTEAPAVEGELRPARVDVSPPWP